MAIEGANADGHEFVPQALEAGAVGTVAERAVPGPNLLVDSLIDALARMASCLRERFHGPVAAVTGSAGKTTTKEFLAAALGGLGPLVKTTGNRNTEYTAPLIWTEVGPETAAVVVEMGMRGFGQIAHLCSFTRPVLGVVTNVGFSHMDLVGSQEGIAEAKGELLRALPSDGTAVLWREDGFFEKLRGMTAARVVSFGFSDAADCVVSSYRAVSWTHSAIRGKCLGEEWSAEVGAAGEHIALDAAAAVAAAQALGVTAAEAARRLANAELPPMRMQVLSFNGVTVVLDAYNASPASTVASLEALGSLPCEGERLAVIGEMLELGHHAEAGHREVGRAVVAAGVRGAAFLGEGARWALEECLAAGADPRRFQMAEGIEGVRTFLSNARAGDTVLIKGSRALELERAVEGLGWIAGH